MGNTSPWAVLALLGLTGSCTSSHEDAPLATRSSASTFALPPGYYRVKDLHPGPGDGLPERLKPHFSLHALGDTLLLRADDGVNGPALWRSDGAEAGTRLVRDFSPDTSDTLGDEPAVLGAALYFFAGDTGGFGLWSLREGAEAPVRVHSLSEGGGQTHSLRHFGSSRLGFVHTAAATGTELWVTDVVAGSTDLLLDLRAGAESSEPSFLRALGDTLLFTADDGVHGRELWRTDGSPAGTRLVRDLRLDGSAMERFGSGIRTTADAAYFAADDGAGACGLWRSDGTEAGTRPVKTFGDGCTSGVLNEIATTASRVFFTAPGSLASELWVSDGTLEGTVSLTEAVPDGLASFHGLITQGDRLFFIVQGSASSAGLWRSDGTRAGTVRVKDVAVHADNLYGYKVLDGLLVFRADDGVHGKELWRSDGTPEGTFMVADLRPGPESSDASHFALAGGRLYFRATDGVSGYELWSIPMAKVHDPFPPTLTCPADVAVDASQSLNITVGYPPAQASDTSGGPVTVGYSRPSGSTFPAGDTQVVVTATDAAGNEARCSFRVTVRVIEPATQPPPPEAAPPSQPDASGCGATSGAPGSTWLGVLAVLGYVWRSRKARAC